MRRIVLLFLDGVGLGARDPATNPVAAARTPVLDGLIGDRPLRGAAPRSGAGVLFRPLDATFGAPGLPQSATGQAALLTGRDAVGAMSGPYGPWPGPTLRALLDEGTLFSAAPGGSALANAYPPGYFAALEAGRLRTNAFAHAARAAGARLRGLDELAGGRAVSPDPSGRLRPPGAEGPPPDPTADAVALLRLLEGRSFAALDVWPTDRAGHARDLAAGVALLEAVDALVGALVERLPDDVDLLLTSDHGNLEDATTRRHTRAEVPLLAVGAGAGAWSRARDLRDVALGAYRAWEREPPPPAAGPAAETPAAREETP